MRLSNPYAAHRPTTVDPQGGPADIADRGTGAVAQRAAREATRDDMDPTSQGARGRRLAAGGRRIGMRRCVIENSVEQLVDRFLSPYQWIEIPLPRTIEMARSIKTTRSSTRRTSAPMPGKRLGRPPGSRNLATSAAKRAAPAPRKTRAAPRTATPAAPKLKKAELEQQVVKLERTIARLRKQNAEMRHAAREGAHEAAAPPSVPVVAPGRVRRSASVPQRRDARPQRS